MYPISAITALATASETMITMGDLAGAGGMSDIALIHLG